MTRLPRALPLLALALGLSCAGARDSSHDGHDDPGVDWTVNNSPSWELSGVAWSGSRFVAVGLGISTSRDGLTWHSPMLSMHPQLEGVTWGGSQFVAVGATRFWRNESRRELIITSPDGITWTEQEVPGGAGSLKDVVWSGNQLVAVGHGSIVTSPDGVAWIAQRMPAHGDLDGVAWDGSQFVAVGYIPLPETSHSLSSTRALVLTSPDGETWTERAVPGKSLEDVAWSGDRLVAVGDTILTSTDGVTWTEPEMPAAGYRLKGITWSGSQFVAVGLSTNWWASRRGLIVTSPDGVRWTERVAPTHAELYDVAWSGTRFAIVGQFRRGWFADYTEGLILNSP